MGRRLQLSPGLTEGLGRPTGAPRVRQYPDNVHLSVVSLEPGEDPAVVDIVAGLDSSRGLMLVLPGVGISRKARSIRHHWSDVTVRARGRTDTVIGSAREAIDATDTLGDANTADLFTEISRCADTYLYFLEAHLQA